LRDDWQIQPRDVTAILSEKPRDTRQRILKSLMSGPIDIDKMDYLPRDSLHAGVPYGRNFDSQRLIGSLCLNQVGDGLALTDKGKTAAEMMVFARYVMFSEVYWHHAVRSATAMLQRGFYLLHGELDLDALFRLSEQAWIQHVLTASERHPAADLFGGLFGPTRRLYKRIAEFSFFQKRPYYEQFARRPYVWLAACSDQLSEILSTHISRRIAPHEILFDAPPIKREVEFNVEIHFPKEKTYRTLGEVSPVVKTLAQSQFDDYVKRVRIFVHPRLSDDLKNLPSLDEALDETLRRMA
jgi:HD superfamily phosphohydrolase